MVVMKPIPVQAEGSERKQFKIQTREYSNSKEKSEKKISNPFRNANKSDIEQEKTLYSNIWDNDKESNHPKERINFYDLNSQDDSESQAQDTALDMTKNTLTNVEETLHDKTEKLFQIAKSEKDPKYIDWKDSTLHLQLKAKKLTDYENQEFSKYYKEDDIDYIIDMVKRQRQDVVEAKIISPIYK